MVNINAQDRRIQYTGNGSAGPFSFSFQVNATSEIKVYVDTTVKTLTTHYTVSLSSDGSGSISFTTGNHPTNSQTITIMSNIAISRTSQFTTGGTLTASALETEFNNQFMHHQQHDQRLDRALLVPEHDTISGADLILPAKSSRLGKILSFNSSTGNPEMTFTVADGQTLSGVATDIALLADIQDGTSATNTLTNLSSISSNVTTVAGISANVTTVAGISSNVTTVAGKASLITSDFASDMALINSSFVTQMNLVTSDFVSDVNTLATSDIVSDINLLATTDVISDLNTLATSDIVSDLNTLATSDIVSDINTLATSDIVSDLNTLATSDIVSDINTLATSDIVTDLALLATSDFVSDLNTMATSSNVSNLNTVAGAVTNVNNVGGSISNVNTVASNISGVNSFAERYRVQSGVPSSDNDVGDLVFDTSANTLKVFGSSGFQNAGSSVNGTSARFTYNISGTPTAVTGSDANGNTLAYDAGFIDVYLNGVKMLNGTDVTVTSGDTVTFASALANGDLVDIVAFGTFSVANIVSTGALNSGSITSGFGNIDTGSSTITTTGAISGGALSGTSLDLNGGELILDADADTSITADTDDQIDIKIAGSDSLRIKANEISNVSGDLLFDVVGDIILDADGADLIFKDGGTEIAHLSNSSSDFKIESKVSDKDIIFRGNDGGSGITALTLDMSDAGAATFNSTINGTNIALGTPLEGHGANSHVIQLGDGATDSGCLAWNTISGADYFDLMYQAYFDGTDYKHAAGSAAATRIAQYAGAIRFDRKAGGTDNATFTWDRSMTIDSSGAVFIGVTSLPANGSGGAAFRADSNSRKNLYLSTSSTSNQGLIVFDNPNGTVGSVTTNGSATAFNTSSDYRLKENVVTDWDATSRLKQLKPSRFNFKTDADKTVDGFIAHEVSSIVPEAITGTKDEVDTDGNPVHQGIDQSKLVPLLVKTIQELEARLTALEAK